MNQQTVFADNAQARLGGGINFGSSGRGIINTPMHDNLFFYRVAAFAKG